MVDIGFAEAIGTSLLTDEQRAQDLDPYFVLECDLCHEVGRMIMEHPLRKEEWDNAEYWVGKRQMVLRYLRSLGVTLK